MLSSKMLNLITGFVLIGLSVSAPVVFAGDGGTPLTFSENLRIERNIARMKLEISESKTKAELRKYQLGDVGSGDAVVATPEPSGPTSARSTPGKSKPIGSDSSGSSHVVERAPVPHYELQHVYGFAGQYFAIFVNGGKSTVPLRVGDFLPGGLRVSEIDLHRAILRGPRGRRYVVTVAPTTDNAAINQYPSGVAVPANILPPYLGYGSK